MRYLLILIALSFSVGTFAQKPISEVDFTAFVKDIYRSKSDGRNIIASFWIPTMYWYIVGKLVSEDPTNTYLDIASVLDDYTVICALDGDLNLDSEHKGWIMKSEFELRRYVSIEYNGKKYLPIESNDLPETLSIMKNILKPQFAQMLGEVGGGINFFFFKIQDINSTSSVDPYKSGSLTVLFEEDFIIYNLPLPSLGNDKLCKEDNAIFPSNYVYCPFHGSKLEEVEAELAEPPVQNVFENK